LRKINEKYKHYFYPSLNSKLLIIIEREKGKEEARRRVERVYKHPVYTLEEMGKILNRLLRPGKV